MAKTVDLRTYLLLERAFVRRLQRAWRIQSAPLYARITQACNDHKWDEARRLVTFLDMTEVGTQNREWITYMLLSFATFGAQTVAKKKPSFVGVGTFDTFLKQVTNNIIQYLELTATAKIQEDALHLIATDEANTKALKFDPGQPRDAEGKWTSATDTPTFKAWFGQSKVVDKEGKPLVVYHGTLASVDFEEFNKTAELGYHFGTAEQANYRTTDYKGRVIPAYLSIQHPIRMPDHVWDTADTATKWAAEHGFDPDGVIQREHEAHTTALAEASEVVGHAYYHGTMEEHRVLERAYAERKREHKKAIFRLFKAALEAKGHDGIVYENEVEGAGDSYIAFYPHQIKSAIGNIGAFDPKDPRITKWDEAEHPRGKGGRFVDAEGVTHEGEFVELYHGTSRRRANKILKEGFKIRAVAKQTMGGDPERNRDYVWLAKRMASAKSYSEMHGQPAVVTVRLPRLLYEKLTPYGRNTGPDSVWISEPIPAKFVTVTKWEESEHPRDKAGKFTEAMLNVTLPVVNSELATIRLKVVRQLADEMAQQMGFDPSRIDVVDEEAKGFSVGEKQFTEAGHYDPATGRIYLNSANITYDETPLVKGVISHEISHAIFHELKQAAEKEEAAFRKKAISPTDQHTDWYRERFTMQKGPSGRTERRLNPEYAEEFARDYPASAVLVHLGDDYFKGISFKMVQENGHSMYAKSYWAAADKADQMRYDHAITETIAEVTRSLQVPQSWEEKPLDPDSPWVLLTQTMHEWYKWQRP